MSTSKREARLNFRLPAQLKDTIEEAATRLGQTVSDFAISTLVHTAQKVLREQQATMLSQRDRDAFIAMLDDQSARPNKALTSAAKRYKKQAG
jgi:uncharacterized protein (DUF1778 family)